MKVYKTEVKKLGVAITRPDGETFTIASGTYKVFDSKDMATTVATGALTVDNDALEVYALIDFSAAAYLAGHSYTLRSHVVITGTGEAEDEDQVIDVSA